MRSPRINLNRCNVDQHDFAPTCAPGSEARFVIHQGDSARESAADKVLDRSRRFTLDEVCVELGVDPDRIRERAARMREEDGDV